MTVAVLAMVSACSSGGRPAAPARTAGPRPASAGAPVAKAGIPGFSGPVDPSRDGQLTHVFGRCLRSWYSRSGSGTRVRVAYPGPADVSVDLTMTDQSEPPPEAHRQFVMKAGRQAEDVRFPVIPHAGFPQITVVSGGRTMICDVPGH